MKITTTCADQIPVQGTPTKELGQVQQTVPSPDCLDNNLCCVTVSRVFVWNQNGPFLQEAELTTGNILYNNNNNNFIWTLNHHYKSEESYEILVEQIQIIQYNAIVKQLGLGTGKWEKRVPPVPGDNSIVSGATTTTHHPTTFNRDGDLWQQSAFSKNVSGWSPKPIQQKKLPGGQQQ